MISDPDLIGRVTLSIHTDERDISLSFRGSATVQEFLDHVASFMRAVGYQINGDENLVVEKTDEGCDADPDTLLDDWLGDMGAPNGKQLSGY